MTIPKHLLIFSSLLTLLVGSYSFVLLKFFPILVHHTFYYCREMAKAISLSLPSTPGVLIIGALILFSLYTIFKLLMTALQIYTFRQSLHQSVVYDHSYTHLFNTLAIGNDVIVLRENKPFAYCFGLWKTKIFITTGLIALVSRKELEIIIRHEKYHLDHKDNRILLLARLVESLFPFFPLLSDFVRIYKTERELLADQAAIQNEQDKRALSSVLKKLLQYEPPVAPAMAIADVDTLETRIKSLLSIQVDYHTFRKKNMVFSSIFIFVLVLLLATPINAIELHNNGLDAMIVCNENVSCDSICQDKRFMSPQLIKFSDISKTFSTNY